MGAYVERLAVPLRWWAMAALAVVAVALIATAFPPAVLAAVTVVTAGGLAGALRAATLTVVVDEHGLTVGRARLPWDAIGAVTPLDAMSAGALRSRDADPRAYLALRGYVATAVRVDVEDEADPTPYWYVSTRHPAALTAALEQRLGEQRGSTPGQAGTGPT